MNEKVCYGVSREKTSATVTRDGRRQELLDDIERRKAELMDVRYVFEHTNIEHREVKKVRRAEDLLVIAEGQLRYFDERQERENIQTAIEAERARRRQPPNLQALVTRYGFYDKIPPWAWAEFDADMADWKAKVRGGWIWQK